MDEMKIGSPLTRKIISKFITSAIKKKTGCKIDIYLNEFNASIRAGRTQIHLDVDADIDKDSLIKLVSNLGVDI